MKSIKPGRYNSGQGIIGSVIGMIFAVFWTITAASMGAPIIFPVFGIGFIILMITELVKNVHNFTNKNRYSEFDIVDSTEEPDPWNEQFLEEDKGTYPAEDENAGAPRGGMYCPYCGTEQAPDFEYCPKCGRKLPY